MDLVDRYVKAVGAFLPRARREDIMQELSANLRAQLEDSEAERGRPLSDAEQEALLQRHGPPMLVAERYLSERGTVVFGRQLIGRTLFPFYLGVLGVTLAIAVVVRVGVLVALTAGGAPLTGDALTNALVIPAVLQFVIITGVFALVDRLYATTPWRARRAVAPPERTFSRRTIPRLESFAQLIALLVVLGWLLAIIDQPSLLFGAASGTYQLGPVWRQIALPSVLILVVSLAQAVVNLVRPDWVGVRRAVRLGTDLAGLGIVAYLLWAGQWVVRVGAVTSGADAALGTVNGVVAAGLWWGAGTFVVVLIVHLWPFTRRVRMQDQPAA